MAGEFELIRTHFNRPTRHTDLGVGDDGALLTPRPGKQLVLSTDMLVAGTHFLPDTAPFDIGWKTAAVNVSDMAAMGAEPRWILLALALPEANDDWVAGFAAGFAACCERFGVDWIGGDTTRGPLNLCATVIGEVPLGAAITRAGAQAGEDLWISGAPGLAALGLRDLQGQCQLSDDWRDRCLAALHRPQPRVELGLALRGIATAMLDVSDGLLGDLGHILEQSRVGALLFDARLPLSAPLAACNDSRVARDCLLGGGDDYELLFTAPTRLHPEIVQLASKLDIPLSCIGRIGDEVGRVRLQHRDGSRQQLPTRGFDHFRSKPHG